MEYGRLQERHLSLEKELIQAEARHKKDAAARAALEKRLAMKDELLVLLKASNEAIKEDMEQQDRMVQAAAAEVEQSRAQLQKQAKQMQECNEARYDLSRQLEDARARLQVAEAGFAGGEDGVQVGEMERVGRRASLSIRHSEAESERGSPDRRRSVEVLRDGEGRTEHRDRAMRGSYHSMGKEMEDGRDVGNSRRGSRAGRERRHASESERESELLQVSSPSDVHRDPSSLRLYHADMHAHTRQRARVHTHTLSRMTCARSSLVKQGKEI